MESAAAAVHRKPMGFAPPCYKAASSSRESRSFSGSVMVGRRRSPAWGILSSGFCDQGYLQYYGNSKSSVSVSVSVSSGLTSGKMEKATKDKTQKKVKKKQLKLLKGLSKDLSSFSQMGFGLDFDGGALVDQVKGDTLSEAAEVLLQRLQKLRAEEKEQKRRMKAEKKSKLKAALMENNCEMTSSSSSSESSDGECGEVVNMKNLKRQQNYQIPPPQETTTPSSTPNPVVVVPTTPEAKPDCLSQATVRDPVPILALRESPEIKMSNSSQENASTSIAPTCCKKVEVCMGGKCKKSGGAALLDKFQEVLGIEGAVSGCKCMGKCRQGPNVKVLNDGVDESSVRIAPSSLCIGVGLEDVDMIVANLLGENHHNQLDFAAAS